MRTLKKVLALSLVFAMAFTMMAGAAFKDQNKIDSSLNNDIQLLTALGVFKGDENGNFNPTDNVKRSEAAKMIYVLKNNGVDDGAVAFQGVSKYSDVPVGHWAEGYINYCTNLGYMGGWKEGNVQKFDPNGNVTGVELMKMLLCMIGYKADVQGYTGNGWQTNVLVDAATSGLSTNFIPSVYGATPRQWTARLMTNALDAKYVTYSKGELTYADVSYGEEFLGLRTVEGILTATNSNKLGTVVNSISSSLNESETVTVDAFTGDDLIAVGDADDNLLGQPVKAYYKKAGTTTEPKLYAVLPYAKNLKVVNTTIDAIKYDSSVKTTVTIDGLGKMDYTKSTVDTDPNTQGNDGKISLYMNNVLVKTDTINNLVDYLGVNDSRTVTVVANKDGYAQTILVDDFTVYAQVKKIDASKNTLTFEQMSNKQANLTKEDGTTGLTFNNEEANKDNFNKYLNVASDVKDGSIVKITMNTSTGKLVYDITLADKVEGTPTGYTVDGNNYGTLTINGTAYKMAGGNNQLKKYDWNTTNNTSLLSDKTFYTDGKYVIFSEGGTTSVSVDNLAYITATNKTEAWGKATYSVKALLSNGTVGEYEVAATYNASGTKTSVANVTGGVDQSLLTGVMSYSISDGKITLSVLKSDSVATGVKFAEGKQTYNYAKKTVATDDNKAGAANGTYVVDANAYFFVVSYNASTQATSYSVVKASELKKDQNPGSQSTFTADYAYKTVNGVKTLLFGVLELDGSVVASAADYAFANANASYVLADGKHTVQMVVTSATGEEVTIKKVVDSQTSAKGDVDKWNKLKGRVITYSLNAEGNVEGDPSVVAAGNISSSVKTVEAGKWNKLNVQGWNASTAYVINKGDGSSALTDAEYVNIASDVKIHYVDVNTTDHSAKLVSDGEVKLDDSTDVATATALAYVQEVNGVKTITDIFVEVDGEAIADIVATRA